MTEIEKTEIEAGQNNSNDTEDTTSSESSTENNETEDTQSPDGEGSNSQDDTETKKPLNEHPRWQERESEWNTRFNAQEQRHQDDLKALRDEFGTARKDNAETTKIPSWFGGTQEQWDAYRSDRDSEITAAEERAVKRVTEANEKQNTAVKEATTYMQTEIKSIETDKTLNPTGSKIDPNKLLKVVLDNDLVDSKGRWNYKAGFRLMQQQGMIPKPQSNGDRKTVAAATTSENRAETKPSTVKTSADFKRNKPW